MTGLIFPFSTRSFSKSKPSVLNSGRPSSIDWYFRSASAPLRTLILSFSVYHTGWNGVKYNVIAFLSVCKILFCIINDRVGPQRLHQIQIRRTAYPGNIRAEVFGQAVQEKCRSNRKPHKRGFFVRFVYSLFLENIRRWTAVKEWPQPLYTFIFDGFNIKSCPPAGILYSAYVPIRGCMPVFKVTP